MITLILGSRPHVIVIADGDHPLEFGPETVYEAANRIDMCETDCDRLRLNGHGWAQHIRCALDDFGAPSMSVGDSMFVTNDGHELGGWRCAPSGWEQLDRSKVRRESAMLGGHLCLA